MEDSFHLFKNCSGTRALAFASSWAKIDNWEGSNIVSFIEIGLNLPHDFGLQPDEVEGFPSFFACLLYSVWHLRNRCVFEGNKNLLLEVRHLNEIVAEFAAGTNLSLGDSLSPRETESWKPPPRGAFKINVDAAFSKGVTSIACIVRDEDGLLVMAEARISQAPSAFIAELMALHWAFLLARSKEWRKVIFSSDALMVVQEIFSPKKPSGWHTRTRILEIREALSMRDWTLEWNARSSNLFADCLAKISTASNCNFLYVDLAVIPGKLKDILVADMAAILSLQFFPVLGLFVLNNNGIFIKKKKSPLCTLFYHFF